VTMIAPSIRSQRTKNPIRALVGSINPPKDHPDPFLNLALGDPTAHGNMAPPTILVEAVQDALTTGNSNGYVPSIGAPAARAAVARFSSLEGFPVDEDDVIVASGCSGSIDLVLSALLDEGDNILVPMPNFPLYQVVAEVVDVEILNTCYSAAYTLCTRCTHTHCVHYARTSHTAPKSNADTA
jgi:tyrosine aminotransferase